jgi:hypothetical protein
MKILNPIGSKKRFLEMFQGVNKIQINEVATNVMQTSTQLIEKAFNKLKNKQANVKQTNTQTVNDENFVEIITNDNNDNEITFTFRINSSQGDQDGVYNVNDAVLTNFKVKSDTFNIDYPENMNAVQEFNSHYGDEILSVISEFANFETDTASVDDEIYEEAIRLIDKVPYKKGTETIQTNKAYADEKPTNPNLRVHSTELEKFVSEMEDYVADAEEDDFALPPDYSSADLPKKSNDKSIGVDPYDQAIADAEAGKSDWEISGKKPEKPKNIPPYMKKDTTVGRERAIPSWAEDFMENEEIGTVDVNASDLANRSYNKTIPFEKKSEYIKRAIELIPNEGKLQLPYDEYILLVKNKAIELYQQDSAEMNEDTEKSDYPDQMGKKFKPKSQFPKKKRKQQSIVKLSEEDEELNINPEVDGINIDVEDKLEGGLGDNKQTSDFCPKQLAMGLEVEMEHTDDPKIALEIAMDHLTEIPDYYTHLDKMEKDAGVEEPQDDELTDELLGYKPYNVNDYTNEEDDLFKTLGDAMRPETSSNEKHVVIFDGTSAYVNDMNNVPEDVEVKGSYDNIDDAQAHADRLNNEIGNISEEDEFDEYTGNVGDRYEDAENNQYTVRNKVKGGVTFQGQGGEKEIDTSDVQLLKKINEEKIQKEIISEQQIKTAKLALKNRDFSNTMTKKEAVQLLIKYNIR